MFSTPFYRRSAYDHYGGYDRGGRGGYADDRSYGRFGHRSGAGYQNGISGMLIDANYSGSSIFMHNKALNLVLYL